MKFQLAALVIPLFILINLCLPTFGTEKNDSLNLLVIQTDEHHFKTLGCYGGKIVGTPNIDWIGNNGAICTSFYATTPVCSPSRGALMSGRYPQHTPVTNNNIRLDEIRFDSIDSQPSLRVFKRHKDFSSVAKRSEVS